jgi:hypothetical protein
VRERIFWPMNLSIARVSSRGSPVNSWDALFWPLVVTTAARSLAPKFFSTNCFAARLTSDERSALVCRSSSTMMYNRPWKGSRLLFVSGGMTRCE